MADRIRLIVGLGNPGREYEDTRHNAGAWYVDALARSRGVVLSEDKKAFGLSGQFSFEGDTIRLLIPTTFMNLSGQASAAVANFYRIPVTEILVAHDELDLPPGSIRLKKGGGHGGHNGLRDIISKHGNSKDFMRLRIGIGHPGDARLVTPHVLNKPSADDRQKIETAIDEALRHTGEILRGEFAAVMNSLNGFKA